MLTLLLASVLSASAADAPRPNVLLICVDDLKPALGCYGDPLARSPSIDRLAARGVRFDMAYCNQAVCSPSRNALLTGLRSQTLGIYDLATNFRKGAPDAVTVGQYFQQHGYRTESLGKIFHVGQGNADDAASWSVPSWRPRAAGYALAESTAAPKPGNGPRGNATESADVADTTYGDGLIADEAVARLRAAKDRPETPFFLAVGFLKPHLPFVAPKRYWDLYRPEAFKLPALATPPEGAPSYAPTNSGELLAYADMPARLPLGDARTRHLIHGYYAAMSYMDAQLGRVLDELDRLGLAKNTVVVLWGDHGWHLGDHGMWCKHTNYEQAARIPVVVAAPGMRAGVKTASLIESVDIYPTLAELAGLPAPKGVEGRSFAAVLRDPSAATKEHVIHVYPRGARIGRAVRTARHRLVEWKVPGAPAETADVELYDLVADPAETRDRAADDPEVVARLRAVLAAQPEAKPQLRPAAAAQAGAPAAKKPQDRAAMFAAKDRDNDGKLTREEFLRNQPDPTEAPKRFERFDVDKDGTLTWRRVHRHGTQAAA